jgi:ADP-heptose:LPS heptosyltransferase
LFTQVIRKIRPELLSRTRRFAGPGVPPSEAARVYVLSRVTLGADVAVTSVLLDAAKRRYPNAEIVFVAPRKNYELFEADSRIRHFPAPYPRSSSLRDRLDASASLHLTGGIVIDPDSRLTQLGLLRICGDHGYFFFNSRAYGDGGPDRLPDLAARWAQEILGIDGARPNIAPLPPAEPPVEITVSLGVGENPNKRIGGDFERDLLRMLSETGASMLVDLGGSDEERRRVAAALPPGARTHDGAFAPFAAQIARSKLFVGYDSAGGHVASACGVPLISIAQGFVSERMQARWEPNGTIIPGDHPDLLESVRRALTYTFRR